MGENALLAIQMYGLAIVISLLVAFVIRGVVSVLAVLKKETDASEAFPTPVAADRNKKEHVAAIAAAVWAVLGPYRIVHIEHTERGQVWTAEGRLTHRASHALGRHPKQWGPRKK
jgi:Na+-transporting methylmalonyl-CoA/oxaloacetate decarboxylase gamma subunit